jgi:hypothetical protein
VPAGHALVLVLHPLLGGGDERAVLAAARQADLVAEEVGDLGGPEVLRLDVVAVVLEREAVDLGAEAAVGDELALGLVVLDLARVAGARALGDEAGLDGEAVAARRGRGLLVVVAATAAAGEEEGGRDGREQRAAGHQSTARTTTRSSSAVRKVADFGGLTRTP